MNQGLGVLVLAILVAFGVISIFILMELYFRRWVHRTKELGRQSVGRSVLLGFVNALFISALAVGSWALAENSGVVFLGALGLILAVMLALGLVFGLAGMVALTAERLFPERSGWKPLAAAAGFILLGSATPYIGWFGLLPYLAFWGLGAFIQALHGAWRERRAAPQAAGE